MSTVTAPPLTPLRVLLLEDRATDAELLLQALRRSGFDPLAHRVEKEADFLAALEPGLDVILADYALPGWSGCAALDAVQHSGFDIPVIIVSGMVGDESAAAVMKQGAADFLLKDRLVRLGAAVRHATTETRLRREQHAAQEALRLAHRQLDQLLEHNPAVLYVLKVAADQTLSLVSSNGISRLLGYAPAARGFDWWLDRVHPDDRARALQGVASALDSGLSRTEYRLRRKDGSYCWIDDARRLNSDGATTELVGVWIDITERKQAEEERARLSADLQTAQAAVKTLRGLLPICASCKHIRDQDGTWQKVEVYIERNSEANFSHGCCPDCVRKLYPDLADRILGQMPPQ